MGILSVSRELEAKLASRTGGLFSKPAGKLERKWYGDASERLKIRVRRVKAPAGAAAVVTAGGAEIARLPLRGGSASFDERADGPGILPALEAGQRIEVRVDGTLILEGVLEED